MTPGTRGVSGGAVVAVTVLALLLAAGARSAPGVFLVPMVRDLGLGLPTLSLSVALGLLMFGLAAPLAGRLMDRHGPRRVATVGLLVVAAAFAASTLTRSAWGLHLTWGVLSGLGTGLVGSVLGATVATRWFPQRRGLVMGLFGAATSAGQLLFIPALTAWAAADAWTGAARGIAWLCLLAAPVVWWRLRGPAMPLDVPPGGVSPTPMPRPDPGIMARALRSRDFWLLSGTFFVCGFTSNGIIGTHFISFCTDLGLSAGYAAGALALMGAFNFVGTLASGYFTDRADPRLLLSVYYVVRGLSLALLPLVPPGVGLTVFAVLFGLDYIATVPPTTALAADLFGRANVGTVYGWIFCAHQVGAALASLLGGEARALTGSYTLAFLAAAALAVAAGALAMGVSAPANRRALAGD